MKIENTFLRSKVARRIFVLFISCAMLPIAALAILSFDKVTTQLEEQSLARLKEANKSMGMAILWRMMFLEQELKLITYNLSASTRKIDMAPSREFNQYLKQHFRGLAVITFSGEYIPLLNNIQNGPELTPEEKQHILSGKTFVSTIYHTDNLRRIFIAIAFISKSLDQEILLAEIDPDFLWYMGYDKETLPLETELCILEKSESPVIIHSSCPLPVSFSKQAGLKINHTTIGQIEWETEEEKYLANYRPINLMGYFYSAGQKDWIIVLSEQKDFTLKPLAHFRDIFSLVSLMSLWIVLILSVNQIRRSLVPLEKLKEGTRRIARREFDNPVTVTSRDEFEDVAAAFNTMASQLSRQFKTLTTIARIDRAILSSLNTEEIVDTVLIHMRLIFHCDSVSVTVLDSDDVRRARTYIGNDRPDEEKQVKTIKLTPEEMQRVHNNPETFFIHSNEPPPGYIKIQARLDIKTFMILPVFLKNELSLIIALGYLETPDLAQDDFDQARQMADQVAVAFSNARLIEELNQLNWGTLQALARAIDAKSRWTAGHSERVAKLALQIGSAMGLPSEELDILHRGGLLHDIGKLGVPPEVLDKCGCLSAEEERLMHHHVYLGVRILDPINAYAEIIPIILHHHENFDGTGYPGGLSGDAISLGARIIAIVDRFEALTSDRPYRKAADREYAIDYIKQKSGSEFDPAIVQTFLQIIFQEEAAGDVSTGQSYLLLTS